MNKKYCFILVLLILTLIFVPTVKAFDIEEEMVYISNDKRESVYQATQKEYFDCYKLFKKFDIHIVKESITPVFTIDMYEYAQSDKFSIKPVYLEIPSMPNTQQQTDDIQGNYYVAKTVTSDGRFAGNIWFSVYDNIVIGHFTYSDNIKFRDVHGSEAEGNRKYQSSSSYADHAERIKNLLNREDFVSPYDVKLLAIDGIGVYFYINDEQGEYFIPLGYQIYEGYEDQYPNLKRNVCLTAADIKEKAIERYEEHLDYMARKEAWEKEHPGETYLAVGGTGSADSISSYCSNVDNILNISEFLNIDMTSPTRDNQPDKQILIVAISCVCVFSVGGIFIFKFVANTRKNNNC